MAADAADCPPGAFCEQAASLPGEEGAAAAAEKDAVADKDEANAASESDKARDAEDAQQPASTKATKASKSSTKTGKVDDAVTVVLPPSKSNSPRVVVVRPKGDGSPPEVIAYEASVRKPVSEVDPPADHVKKHKVKKERHRRWGLQLRGSGLILPRQRYDTDAPAMGGGGISLRYRPIAPLAIDAGMDVLMGYDSNGLQRREVPFNLSMMLFLLPHSVVQPYAMVGVNAAYARVDSNRPQWNLAHGTSDRYTYLGGHAGLGLDLRLAPVISLSVDGLAFVRERVDDSSKRYPEFYDPNTGETSNTSVGGQIRGGLTFWW